MFVRRSSDFPDKGHWGVLVFEPQGMQYHALETTEERNKLIAGLGAKDVDFVVFPAHGKVRVKRRMRPVLYIENTPIPASPGKSEPQEAPETSMGAESEANLISDVRKRFIDANGLPLKDDDETQELTPIR